jgi:methylenetetrahydrofolate dehydrogenase (NADP+)/methenyltetrahydrofolate cyclohydrolase
LDDLAYENTIKRAAKRVGVSVLTEQFAVDATTEEVLEAVKEAGADDRIQGILIFRPLPAHMDEDEICEAVPPAKDVDGVGVLPMALLYKAKSPAEVAALKAKSFLPATSEAVLAILSEYDVPLAGRSVLVIGRSTVIGKPIALLLLTENATVTVAHSRSHDLKKLAREAEILIVCVGKTKRGTDGKLHGWLDEEYLTPGQIVIDVGMNADDEGKMMGDVDRDTAAAMDISVTPVPGGVGGVTTETLIAHVISAAQWQYAAIESA